MIKILYEDNHLLAADKPHGLLTQPSGTGQASLEEACKALIAERDEKRGNVFLHALHRLDREVGGIVLFAKSQKALKRLSEASRQRAISKEYEALVEGEPEEGEGELVDTLLHGSHRAEIAERGDPRGKEARLTYRLIERGEVTSRLSIALLTGRYHQIRLQLAHAGTPILGDRKYGARLPYSGAGIALKHVEMRLLHPTTGEPLVIRKCA